VFFALLLVGAALIAQHLVPALTGAVRVADGDSLEIGGERVRLDGIDAPELHQSCGAPGQTWPCGERARAALMAIVAAAKVSCRHVGEERYGRAAGRGIWSGPFDLPADWRAAHPRPSS